MVHTGIFATSDEIIVKAGKNYDVLITEARINQLCLEVESRINCLTRYNWSDKYASLNVDVKYILSELESNLVAMYIIAFNPSVYTSLAEAQTMLDMLRDGSDKCMNELQDIKGQDFINNA